MEKQDLKKFVGLPYKFLGVDYNGVDCIGLCQLFYQEHCIDLEWRDGRPIAKDWYVYEPYRLARFMHKHFTRVKNVDDMQYGDIVLYEINGEGHTGVYVGEHKVLTILHQFQRSMIVRLRQNNLFFKSGYRKKVTA